MAGKLNISDAARHARAKRMKRMHSTAKFIFKRRLAQATINVPRDARDAIVRGLKVGLTPGQVHRQIRLDYGEIHIVVIEKVARMIDEFKNRPRRQRSKSKAAAPTQ